METSNPFDVELHSARRYVYAMCQAVLGGEPTPQLLAGIDAELLGEAVSILGLPDDCGVADAALSALEDVEGTRSLYVRLFVGPGKLAATPWESTYRSKSEALFTRDTLDVRNSYRSQGFLPAGYPRVADDHIALELGFMALLAGRAADAAQAENRDALSEAVAASRTFLDTHLLKWADDYARDLRSGNRDSVFSRAMDLALALAKLDGGPAEA